MALQEAEMAELLVVVLGIVVIAAALSAGMALADKVFESE